MLNVRQIRRKIRTIQNIQQITDAMKRVAAAKLRRVQDRVTAARPYAEKLDGIMGRVSDRSSGVEHPLLAIREPRRVLLAVIGSDRGFCGSYNGNVIRYAARFVAEHAGEVELVTVNQKVTAFFEWRDYNVKRVFRGLSEESTVAEVREFSVYLRDCYAKALVDEVHLCYSEFISTVTQVPKSVRLLPFAPEAPQEEVHPLQVESEYILEPNAESILLGLIPVYIDTQCYHAVLEAAASEHAARMMAMTSATDNARDMVADLTRTYNRARQASITTELLEVVAGADALEERD